MTGGYSAATFHPDGLILGTGTADSMVRPFSLSHTHSLFLSLSHTHIHIQTHTHTHTHTHTCSGDPASVQQ